MNTIEIPNSTLKVLRGHLFQNELEQGAFLFALARSEAAGVQLVVKDYYLVPPSGWDEQMDVYLQMRDAERAKIMKMARDRGACTVDCHSHPHADADVWFSPSDIHGITDFAQYAKWKLSARPFAAMVWGRRSVDAVVWGGDFSEAQRVDEVRVLGTAARLLRPTNSWFRHSEPGNNFSRYE